MTKKEYMKPSVNIMEADSEEQILAGWSVQTSGLDENLGNDGSGDSWSEAMGRRHSGWDEEEEW